MSQRLATSSASEVLEVSSQTIAIRARHSMALAESGGT
jgi:hypothetical protein